MVAPHRPRSARPRPPGVVLGSASARRGGRPSRRGRSACANVRRGKGNEGTNLAPDGSGDPIASRRLRPDRAGRQTCSSGLRPEDGGEAQQEDLRKRRRAAGEEDRSTACGQPGTGRARRGPACAGSEIGRRDRRTARLARPDPDRRPGSGVGREARPGAANAPDSRLYSDGFWPGERPLPRGEAHFGLSSRARAPMPTWTPSARGAARLTSACNRAPRRDLSCSTPRRPTCCRGSARCRCCRPSTEGTCRGRGGRRSR